MTQATLTHQTVTHCLPTVLAVFFAPLRLCVKNLRHRFGLKSAGAIWWRRFEKSAAGVWPSPATAMSNNQALTVFWKPPALPRCCARGRAHSGGSTQLNCRRRRKESSRLDELPRSTPYVVTTKARRCSVVYCFSQASRTTALLRPGTGALRGELPLVFVMSPVLPPALAGAA